MRICDYSRIFANIREYFFIFLKKYSQIFANIANILIFANIANIREYSRIRMRIFAIANTLIFAKIFAITNIRDTPNLHKDLSTHLETTSKEVLIQHYSKKEQQNMAVIILEIYYISPKIT